MKLLERDEAQIVLAKLLTKFGYTDSKKLIDNYLDKQPIKLPLVSFHRESIPLLWFPQKKELPYVYDIWPAYVAFESGTESVYGEKLQQLFLPKLITFLKQEKIAHLYAVAEGEVNLELEKRGVREISPHELAEFLQQHIVDGYFFSGSLDWIFCVTHENFSFLAGSEDFIERFKKELPEYQSYALRYPMLGPDTESTAKSE